jgi:hypothetical protein
MVEMHKHYNKIQKQTGLLSAICGSLLIGLLVTPMKNVALAMPRMEEEPLSQANPRPSTSPSPLNPRPNIFKEAPYNRSRSTPVAVPSTSSPGSVIQPPLPEEQQAPSAMVMPIDGKINIKLTNATNAVVTYQVIGDTDQRSLEGSSDVTLQNIATPVTLTFLREDKGLLKVTLQTTSPGVLEVMLDETTNLDEDQDTVRVEKGGTVFVN